jgi:hypothetical protein
MRTCGRRFVARPTFGAQISLPRNRPSLYLLVDGRLVNAPHLEAVEIVAKLYDKDSENRNNRLRMVLYHLAKFINEEQFANEFLRRDGLKGLVDVINSSHGNPLAVSLSFLHPCDKLT